MASNPAHKTKTILVVDDEDAIRGLICTVLRQVGYRVLEAGDGETATRIHGRHPGGIDLLLTDIGLPGQNGCELAETLHKREPVMHILFMSGLHGAEVSEFKGVPQERYRFLQKPFGLNELLQRVRHFLEPSGPPESAAA
jgi:two-component system cell cycle sensor histidine kinase/response regulator CckA